MSRPASRQSPWPARLSSLASLAMVGLALQAARLRARELAAEREGRLTPLGPDGGIEPPESMRGMAARVCTWQPPALAPERRRWAMAWTSPATAIGLAMAVLGGSRPRWDGRIGAFVATDVGGLSGWALARAGLGANTMGHTVVVRASHASERLLDHEALHVRQFERLGVFLYPLYLWYAARYGYRDHPLEIAARRAASEGRPG